MSPDPLQHKEDYDKAATEMFVKAYTTMALTPHPEERVKILETSMIGISSVLDQRDAIFTLDNWRGTDSPEIQAAKRTQRHIRRVSERTREQMNGYVQNASQR